MSADNGIYIVSSIKDDGFGYSNKNNLEYRVAHAQAIEDCEENDENEDIVDVYRFMQFHDAPVFTEKKKAWEFAIKEAEKYEFLEYGICSIDFNAPFPKMTLEEADARYDDYFAKLRIKQRELEEN
jgi:hypothetical protein